MRKRRRLRQLQVSDRRLRGWPPEDSTWILGDSDSWHILHLPCRVHDEDWAILFGIHSERSADVSDIRLER